LIAYDLNTGLPIEANRALAEAAGLKAEPLYNPSIDGWYKLLVNYGLLWTSFAWQSGTRRGRHIIILNGIVGDGTPGGTQIRYIDPADGQTHTMPFTDFFPQHELGFTIAALQDPALIQFSQVMHYP
jgi:Papain-like cysteine protease AvrRpt2